MLTATIYYADPHCRCFSATVSACAAAGDRYALELSQTAFYPEGGGQACDLGRIGEALVLDVQEIDGRVVHFCQSPVEIGTIVDCAIDWDRRFDLMQQHSGEHIISVLVNLLTGLHNVGFHVGAEAMEIDFDGPIDADTLDKIELLANQAVTANLPIGVCFPTQEDRPHTFYRTKKALPWPVRLVEIPGVDVCACCGVHVTHTGEIGLIKILSAVKFHQGVRLTLVCGGRAYRYMQEIFKQNRTVSQLFSAKPLETGVVAEKMAQALAAEKLRAIQLQSRLLKGIAEGYRDMGNCWHFEEGLDGNGLRELADAMSRVCGGWAAALTGGNGGCNVCILSQGTDMKELCAALKQKLNARGGGKPGSFQGSIPAGKEAIEEALKEFV